MTSPFENLAGPGKALRAEPPDAKDFAGFQRSALARLKDGRNQTLPGESQFDLAYNAAHALCLAQALHTRFGDRFAKLDKTAVQAVVTAQVEGSVTNGRMQEITGEHPKDITAVLQALVRDGLLTQQNQRRWASYRVTGDSPQPEGSAPDWEADSPQSSPQFPPDSPQSARSSPQSSRLARLPADVAALLPLAELARKNKKLPAGRLRAIIQQLCAGK